MEHIGSLAWTQGTPGPNSLSNDIAKQEETTGLVISAIPYGTVFPESLVPTLYSDLPRKRESALLLPGYLQTPHEKGLLQLMRPSVWYTIVYPAKSRG